MSTNPLIPPLPSTKVTEGANMLMIFMLAATQKTQSGANLVDLFFPPAGTTAVPSDNNHMTDLGVSKDQIATFVTNLNTAFGNDLVRSAFGVVRVLFDAVFNYSGPDCPSPGALKNIIATAVAQTVNQ